MANPWEKFPEEELKHLKHSPVFERMLKRRRHRFVRYNLFRFQTIYERIDRGEDVELTEVEKMPGFLEFWLEQKPEYQEGPNGLRSAVDPKRDRTVEELGGYRQFGVLWDVDDDLRVYLRHSSVWHQWDAKLMAMTPQLIFRPR